MKQALSGLLVLVLLLSPMGGTLFVSASYESNSFNTVRFNNENWQTLPHPRVASFSLHADGSMLGFTDNGITFFQYNIPNTYGIRVQRFEMQDHYHYIVNGQIASTVSELSALLALAYADSIHG